MQQQVGQGNERVRAPRLPVVGTLRERALRGMDEATRIQMTRLLEQVRDNLTSED